MTIALILLLLLHCFSLIKGKSGDCSPFDLKHTLPLRGILALLVVFGHLDTVVSGQTKVLMPLHMATPAVAVFFFMSGYGLMSSYLQKGKLYLNRFVTKSAIKLLLPLFITTVLYQVILFFIGDFSMDRIIDGYITGKEAPLMHSWYVYALFVFYLIYYLAFHKDRSQSTVEKCLVITFLIIIYYIITRYVFGWDFFWWITCLAFPMGFFYKQYEDSIKDIIKQHYWIPIPIVVIVLIIKMLSGEEVLLLSEIPYLLIGPLVAVLLYRLPLPTNSVILNFLGTISFEIYLTHGAFEVLFKDVFASPYLYIIAVVTFTVLFSWVLHNVYHKMTSKLLSRLNNE